MAQFKILKISNNLDDYPEAIQDTDKYPHLIKWLDDEFGLFVANLSNGDFFPAAEFFYMVEEFKEFETNPQQLKDELAIATAYIDSLKRDDAPKIANGRIKLTDKDKTWLKMRKQ